MSKLKELLQQLIELIDNDEFIEIDDDIIEQLSNLIHRPATNSISQFNVVSSRANGSLAIIETKRV